MRTQYIILFGIIALALGCQKNKAVDESEFPAEVQIIFANKCATAGCHNDASYQNAANLNMTTWAKLMQGGNSGSVVIPYAPAQSSLLQFVNTYEDLGLINLPTMPLNDDVLSRDEVLTIRRWIEQGCPDKNGVIPFAANPEQRSKAYISNQGCDLVSVVDNESGLVMRYVKVGHDPVVIEVPHNIRMSTDRKYWYVCFTNGAWFQKYDAVADTLVAEVNITEGAWNVVKLNADNSRAIISDLSDNGRIVEVDVTTMKIKKQYSGTGLFNSPHGIAYTQTGDTIYATAQYGNMIYRLIPSLIQLDKISIEKDMPPVVSSGSLEPHEISFSPDYSKYFVTCQKSNEVRVLNAKSDTLLAIIPVGIYPLEMAMSPSRNLLFITCQEDVDPINPFFRGSVYMVNMSTYQVVHKVYEKFFQPHGLMIDDSRGLLYVASRNVEQTGPAPHHKAECAGQNGFFHVIDIDTWNVRTKTSEISVDPYSVDIR